MNHEPQRPGAEHATDKYGPLFLVLIAVFSLAAFAGSSQLLRVILGWLVIGVFVATLRATGVTPKQMRVATLAAGTYALVVLVGGLFDRAEVSAGFGIIAGVLLAVGVLMLMRRVFEHEQVTVQLVVASLAAYLQVALVFAFIYGAAAELSDGMFFAQGDVPATSVLYFSVVTMTTLGYGDLSPGTNLGQALVMIQTLFGQIFLVVLVAYLVGSLGGHRPQLRKEPVD